MATRTGRNYCVTCGKDKATLRCGGCLQEFCFNHSTDHRLELSKQLDEVEVTRDLFRQTLTEETTDPQKHALMQQINDWERDSTEKIRQTAEEARNQLLKHTTAHIEQIEMNLNTLTEQLRQCREENDFYETDLRHWNEELTRLAKELAKPSSINLRQDTTSLINKITVEIISESSSVPKWNNGTDGSSEGVNTFRTINNNENSYPNSGEGFGSRRSGSGFGARGGRGGFRGGGGNGLFEAFHDDNSRACYNCNQTGHTTWECPAPRKENNSGGGRGGFNSGGNRGGFNSGSNDGRDIFGSSGDHGGFNLGNDRGGFHSGGGRGAFNSGGGRGGFNPGDSRGAFNSGDGRGGFAAYQFNYEPY